jgi:pilus assembly protein CpaC
MNERRTMMAKWTLALLSALFALSAVAQDEGALLLGIDRAEVIHLPAAAERVIVGNPALADVTVDSPRLISVFGRAPGETNLIVLGAHDQLLLSRALVVSRGSVAVHVPGKDGPAERDYACSGGRCRLLPAPMQASVQTPAPPPTPAPPAH